MLSARRLAGFLASASLCLLAAPSGAAAQASLIAGLGGDADYGESSLARNDDGSTAFIDLTAAFPAGLRFYGSLYTGLYLNNNGNVSFAGPLSTYTPDPFPVAARPMIAPWWGDVDTRSTSLTPASRNLAYWDIEPGRFVATWYDVGYFASHVDRINNFQMIITDASAFGVAGSFDVEFRYNRCEWTTGDASGGSGGLGGTPAQAGFDAGDDINYLTLPGSRTMAILDVCTTSNVGEIGVWRFQVRPGGVTTCGNGTRELGEDCDDGNVVNGDGCNDRCATERGPGSPCVDDIECRSGFCTDGVCCGSRCGGQCEACNEAGSAGTCVAVAGAPRGSRTACAGSGPCGGACNGTTRTSCVFASASTACDDGAFCTTGDRCDGAGTCGGAARTCSDGNACTTDSCSESTDACVSAPAPAGTSCDDGTACTTRDLCNAAGSCAGTAITCPDDGLACTASLCSPSTGTCGVTITTGCVIGGRCIADGAASPTNPCLVCNPAVSRTSYSPGAVGRACSDPSCAAGVLTPGGTCDVAGMCVVGPPEPCPSGECDGPICRGPCVDDADCTRPTFCDAGRCVPDLPNGDPCSRRGMCISELCVDGVCCESGCTGVCESCGIPGRLGECAPHAAGTDPEDECAGMLMCDGDGKCEVPVIDAGGPDGGVDAGTVMTDDAAVVGDDAAVAPGDDAALPTVDAAGSDAAAGDDAGSGAFDAGGRVPGLAGGACACSAPGSSLPTQRSSAVWLLGLIGLVVAGRRARRGR
jgi:cysteine-rich repeat protein